MALTRERARLSKSCVLIGYLSGQDGLIVILAVLLTETKFDQYSESHLGLMLGKYRVYNRNQLAILLSDCWHKRKYPLIPLLIPLHCQSQ